MLDGEHLRVIQTFIRDLPGETPAASVSAAEEFLAEKAAELRPDQLEKPLAALVRGQLGDPTLGHHNGLPVAVIVSTISDQVHAGCGYAVTAGGTLLPVPDLIRMASHAWHYLCVFDKHCERALYLGRSKRIASADQRIVLHAKDCGHGARLRYARLSLRGPSRRRVGRWRAYRCRRAHFRMHATPQTHRPGRVAHPETP